MGFVCYVLRLREIHGMFVDFKSEWRELKVIAQLTRRCNMRI